ncbi:hypothetical protein MRB53_016531 [Persea americana]|uniref:Uncharacterized protein n=1 Tax=Persea americana TaxID=3435 RepID=A0ACC2M265_PERAE|nr:hypothetical protein MRB53_016531 [Persea americana]
MEGRKGHKGEMLESVYSVLALVFILVACVELCDAATVVDVYRLSNMTSPALPSDHASRVSTTTLDLGRSSPVLISHAPSS